MGTENYIPVTNPIESTFATVRHRTRRTKGCLSRKTGLAMAFKLMMSAQAKWRKLDGRNRMPELIEGVAFRDGVGLQAAARSAVTKIWVYLRSPGRINEEASPFRSGAARC